VQPPITTAPLRDDGRADRAWRLTLAAAGSAERLTEIAERAAFALRDAAPAGAVNDFAQLCAVPDGHPDAAIVWQPGAGWQSCLSSEDPAHALLDLYLPICSATAARPITVGHLGQSLDGFIAMHTGESQFVTGPQNILHLHRMRALCDAVIVGAGTVAADNPQLTTRHVAGPSPLRVVFDPSRRLTSEFRIFSDDAAPTMYACARSLVAEGETHFGRAAILGLDAGSAGEQVVELLGALRARGGHRIFVEGGGVTVSAFLEANLLDRLHMAIAPLIIGDGRPAIRLPPRATLSECHRPRYRVFRMGGDVLFDCELRTDGGDPDGTIDETAVTRLI
jgi:diaminohydroxyphosphoribosylaminopyrimidine deaminase / 5-amino-6-(5-phosphoribosylamino)uracil reductase